MSDEVAARVQAIRRAAGISREQLAELCRDLGAPATFSGSVVANIETGRPDADRRRRRDVTVDELVRMAAALNVPPLYLLYEVEDGAWPAARWFTGEQHDPQPGVPPTSQQRWNDAVAVLDRLRWQDVELDRWDRAATREGMLTRQLRDAGDDDGARDRFAQQLDAASRDRRAAEETLTRLRADMRSRGIEPAALPPGLAHIDDDEDGAP